jgi:hypothetical protein
MISGFPSIRTSCAILLLAGAAFGGSVRGRINGQEKLVPDVYAEAAKPDAHRYTWREPSPTVKPEFRVLSGNPLKEICIAAIAAQQQPPHEPAHLVKVTGGRTVPATIAISNGTRIAFKNTDPFPHKMFIVGAAGNLFKAEEIGPGKQRDFTAPNGKGRYEFRDELFPSLRTFVVVDPNVADITYPGRDGAFELNLGSGEYTLEAFFNGEPVGTMSVTVKEKGTIPIKDPFNLARSK